MSTEPKVTSPDSWFFVSGGHIGPKQWVLGFGKVEKEVNQAPAIQNRCILVL